MQVNRRLYRCRENRVIAGVASGVAEFFGLDPTLVRVLWFVSALFGGIGLILYIGLWIIVPVEPLGAAAGHAAGAGTADALPEGHRHTAGGGGRWVTFFGIALILLGGLALVGALLPNVAMWRYFGPLFVIGMGAVLVVGAMRRGDAPTTPAAPLPPASVSPTLPQEPTES
jgi:phage shock protein C